MQRLKLIKTIAWSNLQFVFDTLGFPLGQNYCLRAPLFLVESAEPF